MISEKRKEEVNLTRKELDRLGKIAYKNGYGIYIGEDKYYLNEYGPNTVSFESLDLSGIEKEMNRLQLTGN